MAAAALALAFVVAMSTQSPATDALKAKIIPRIQLANADGREAFANLGKAAGAKIDVANEVQGIVTLELVNVTFDVAMQTMARQLDAIHFYQGDTVYVVRKPTGGGQSMMTPTSAEIAEMERMDALLRSKVVSRFRYRGNDLGEAIGVLLREAKVPHLVMVDHRMPIEADLRDVDVRTVLATLGQAHFIKVDFLRGAKVPTLVVRSNRNAKSTPLSYDRF